MGWVLSPVQPGHPLQEGLREGGYTIEVIRILPLNCIPLSYPAESSIQINPLLLAKSRFQHGQEELSRCVKIFLPDSLQDANFSGSVRHHAADLRHDAHDRVLEPRHEREGAATRRPLLKPLHTTSLDSASATCLRSRVRCRSSILRVACLRQRPHRG